MAMIRSTTGPRTFFLLAVLWALPAQAQQGFELTAYAGVTAFLGDDPVGIRFGFADRDRGSPVARSRSRNGITPGRVVGLAARQRLGERWAIQVEGLFSYTDVTPPRGSGGVPIEIRTVSAGLLYHLPLGSAEAFILAGAGPRWYASRRGTAAYPSWNVGGGMTWTLGPVLGLRVEARNHMAVTDVGDFQHPNESPDPSDPRFQSDISLLVGLTLRQPEETPR